MNAKLQATEAEAKQVQERLQTQLTEQTKEKETAQHRVRDLTQKVSSLESECKTKELELTTLRVQVAHSKESVQRMQNEHDATKAQLKAKEEQLVRAQHFRTNHYGDLFISHSFSLYLFVVAVFCIFSRHSMLFIFMHGLRQAP